MAQTRQGRADGLMMVLGLRLIAREISRQWPSASWLRPSLQTLEGRPIAKQLPQDESAMEALPIETYKPIDKPKRQLSPAAVPASRLSRLFQYTTLAAGLGIGSAAQALRNVTSADPSSSLLLSPKNTARLVSKLILMRGAALKMGQMLSIQDNDMFPKELDEVLKQVQNGAHYMPHYQMEEVMRLELGEDWRQDHFEEFEDVPSAAASIGQVHRATLKDGTKVAVKVQYPGVAESIDSDLSYLKSLLTLSPLLPKGLYLDNTIRVARKELGWECDYIREARSTTQFRNFVKDKKGLNVPRVHTELSTSKIITTDWVEGMPLGEVVHLSQARRNHIAERMLRLCLDELFVYRFMQTDPNWTNFLYNIEKDTIHLLDFGAAREYSKPFTDMYMHLLCAASRQDKEACIHWSRELGFLTGNETKTMNDAHVTSLLLLAQPFSPSSPQPYSFATQTITDQVRSAIPTMLRERLTPPPDEVYSLHRKLSGCFLFCTKIRASIPAARIFKEYIDRYSS